MMARFDDLVTDRRLRRDAILARREARADEPYLGRYRAMTTSRPSRGARASCLDPDGLALDRRPVPAVHALVGTRPRLPQRTRLAAITGAGSTHIQPPGLGQPCPIPVHRVLPPPLDADHSDRAARRCPSRSLRPRRPPRIPRRLLLPARRGAGRPATLQDLAGRHHRRAASCVPPR